MDVNGKGKGLVLIVLYVGVFIQFMMAGFLFLGFSSLAKPYISPEKMRVAFALLSAFMLATPLGFMLSNFIFHMIKPLREKLDAVSDYTGTQRLLGICLLFSLFVVVLSFVFFYFLIG